MWHPGHHVAAIAAAWMLLHTPSSVDAQSASGRRSSLTGVVLDSASAPVPGAQVLLVELARIAITDRDGGFRFENIAAGRHLLHVRRLGYAEERREIEAPLRDGVVVRLRFTAIQLSSVVVTSRRERGVGESFQPTAVLEGAALDRGLGASIAATIAGEPGVTLRYNGPMAAQPVVRGLAGDRVLVLEDGLRTGDLATTAPDHAVAIDPLSARRVEVIRGPAGLLHGTNTLGGVVNHRVQHDAGREAGEVDEGGRFGRRHDGTYTCCAAGHNGHCTSCRTRLTDCRFRPMTGQQRTSRVDRPMRQRWEGPTLEHAPECVL